MKQRFLNTLNRNMFLFVAGMLGVAHETLLQHAERPTLLILFAAMMGLPAFLTSTEIFPHDDKKDDKKEKKLETDTEKQEEEKVALVQEEQEGATHGKG